MNIKSVKNNMPEVQENKNKSAEEKVEDLKKDIADLGYSIEETEEGEIKISE